MSKPMPLAEWLNERYENCLRLAMHKPKRIAVGWMEDAAYFQAAIIKLKAMKKLLEACNSLISEIDHLENENALCVPSLGAIHAMKVAIADCKLEEDDAEQNQNALRDYL